MKELKKRLVGRGTETKEKVLGRFKAAYQEINQVTQYNYVVVNDDLEEAVNKVEAIIKAEKCRVEGYSNVKAEHVTLEVGQELQGYGPMEHNVLRFKGCRIYCKED